jgi:hypothetical protein
MAKYKTFTADQFQPMQTWYTAQDKADYGNALLRFIESDFNENLFTKKLYNHLNSSFGHIAHYNQAGFYDVWFSSLARRVDWLHHITDAPVFGSPAYTRSDVELAIKKEITERGYLAKYEAKLAEAIKASELAILKALQAKYPDARG